MLPNGVGGIAEIATIIRNAKPDLILDAGDISTGTFLADEFKGEPTIRAMNEIGYTAGTIGNHEFDYGQDALRCVCAKQSFRCFPPISKRRFGDQEICCSIRRTTQEVKPKVTPAT